ncbi:hypothetical protein [Chamaesiphon sp. VAR_48_metabat_403]|uniref:hypothetical protein n=1 Tax=Chamaesiphon sp. VAR_48_metabat_403 TaxID=2964700 RepID=UPI00286DD6F5|nr:hypothetical protein [Chamaesiphon sp. VAR_48_metabat_403]
MHKTTANHQLGKIVTALNGHIWLLHTCNHSDNNSCLPHHVRDRISEAMVGDIEQIITDIGCLQSAIAKNLDNEDKEDPIPF